MIMMRGFGLLLAGALCAGSTVAARAQTGKKPQPAAVEKVATIFGGATANGGDVDFEGELRLSFRGTTLTAATLDACTSTDPTSGVSDRFKATLSIKGNELTGSGSTDIGRQPFTVALKRSGNADSVDLGGQISVSGVPISLKSEGVDLQPVENSPEDAAEPEAGAVPTFNTLTIRTPLGRAREVVEVLRAQQATLSALGLVPSCADMRGGTSQLAATVEPGKAAAILAQLNALDGVQAKMGEITPNMTVRLGGPQSEADDGHIVATVTAAVAAATGGTPIGPTTLDARTGTYRVNVRRDTLATKRLGLAEQISTTFLIGRSDKDRMVYVNLSNAESTLVDPAPQGKLALSDVGAPASEEGGSQTGTIPAQFDEAILARVAKDLNGQVWDGEKSAWK
jgi:hypothetical protein